MSIDPKYMAFTTKGDEAGSDFNIKRDFDFTREYNLRVNYIGDGVSAKTQNPYYQIIWEFVDQNKYGKWLIYDRYYMCKKNKETGGWEKNKWKISQFENLYRNWGLPHKGAPAEGRIVQATLAKETYISTKSQKEVEKFAIADIKQWVLKQNPPAQPSDFDQRAERQSLDPLEENQMGSGDSPDDIFDEMII